MSQIREAIYGAQTSTLIERFHERYSFTPDQHTLDAICDLARDPDAPTLGGSDEYPWSDQTWLDWIRNRIIDLENNSVEQLRKRFLRKKQKKSTLRTVHAWRCFLSEYREVAERLACLDDAIVYDFTEYSSTSDADIARTERRLGVHLPPSIRTFYLASNGWPADGWYCPAINPIHLLTFLKDHDPGLCLIAEDAECTPGPWKDDPEGKRLEAYQIEQGLRVKRSIAMSYNTDDTEIILTDPRIMNDAGEWPMGSWAHWHPAMKWSHGSFDDYMYSRLDRLRQQEFELQ
jgi:hypothetical protein